MQFTLLPVRLKTQHFKDHPADCYIYSKCWLLDHLSGCDKPR